MSAGSLPPDIIPRNKVAYSKNTLRKKKDKQNR